MIKKISLICVLVLTLFASCKKNLGEMVTPNASGSPYDLYIVMDPVLKESALNDTLKEIFEYPMECNPQGDPYFKLCYLTPDNFKSPVIRIVGNVVMVDIDANNGATPRVTLERDMYAQTQVVVKMHAKSVTALAEYLPTLQTQLRDVFVKAEISRKVKLLQTESNHFAADTLMKKLQVSMLIPQDIKLYGVSDDPHFFWITNDLQRKRTDYVVYAVPYTDANIFTLEGAVAVRDSVLGANIKGAEENSFMTTNKKIVLPEYRALSINGKYVGELRGWWRLENGLMAGPFICHIRLDEVNKRVVFAEGYCFSPNDSKRNLIRTAEAVLYTLQLPSDNTIPSIDITL